MHDGAQQTMLCHNILAETQLCESVGICEMWSLSRWCRCFACVLVCARNAYCHCIIPSFSVGQAEAYGLSYATDVAIGIIIIERAAAAHGHYARNTQKYIHKNEPRATSHNAAERVVAWEHTTVIQM